MDAVVLTSFGPPENLTLQELPDLEPGTEECRIAVRASGVHLVDTTIRSGEPGPMPPPALPTIPGREVAGIIDQVGPQVDPSYVGRRVVAHLGPVPGGYASQAVTAVANVFELPDGVTEDDAIAMVGTGRTTLGILELEPIRPDDVVLVPSAAGGIGWLLVQAAHEAGATVVALAGGPDKVARLSELAPHQALDYLDPRWPEQVSAAPTVVYDGVGGAVGRAALDLLAPGGRHVIFGYASGQPTELTTADVLGRSLTVRSVLGPPMFALPGGIAGLAGRALARHAQGRWKPLVTAYSLGNAAGAHRDLEERRALGKVVLHVD